MNKLHYAITYFFIGIVIVACLFFSGCKFSLRVGGEVFDSAPYEQKIDSLSSYYDIYLAECREQLNKCQTIACADSVKAYYITQADKTYRQIQLIEKQWRKGLDEYYK